MVYTVEEKVVFITGGANGIGKCLVEEFLKSGAKHVAFLDIDESTGRDQETKLRSVYGEDKATFVRGDVTNNDDLFGAYNEIRERHGYIDIVVNNAGVCNDSPTFYKKEIEINFTSAVTSSMKALELMRTDAGGNGGTIINVSSITALQLQSPSFFIYSATKAAVLHFSICIGKEDYFKKTGVRVLSVCIGQTTTNLQKIARMYDNKITIDEVTASLKGYGQAQTAGVAAKGIVESCKLGNTGTTWLLNKNKVFDITDKIYKGYETMGKDLSL